MCIFIYFHIYISLSIYTFMYVSFSLCLSLAPSLFPSFSVSLSLSFHLSLSLSLSLSWTLSLSIYTNTRVYTYIHMYTFSSLLGHGNNASLHASLRYTYVRGRSAIPTNPPCMIRTTLAVFVLRGGLFTLSPPIPLINTWVFLLSFLLSLSPFPLSYCPALPHTFLRENGKIH